MRKRMLVTLPFPLAKLQGAMLQLLPNPPLTLDQVRLLEKDNVVSEAAKRDHRTLEGLGIDPVAVEAVVPDYLEQYRPKGGFSRLPALSNVELLRRRRRLLDRRLARTATSRSAGGRTPPSRRQARAGSRRAPYGKERRKEADSTKQVHQKAIAKIPATKVSPATSTSS